GAAPGAQRYPGHWSGDPECTFLDLANTLRGGLAASMSGLAYWSHDMGGFWGDPAPELFVRWSQAGFLSALSRFHGATRREPWRYGDDALRFFRQYARLRSRLVPYVVSDGWQASEDGVPRMRAMVMEFPDGPAGYAFDLQYCLGRELLVSPVVRADGMVTTYLPGGKWTDWWTGAVHEGPTTIRRQVPLEELPLYVRDESLVVLGPERSHVSERPADPLTVEAFVTNEAVFSLRGDAGTVALRCGRRGNEVLFEASAAPATFVLRLRPALSATSVSADGQPISRVDAAGLERSEAGWTVADRVVVVKARARRIEIRRPRRPSSGQEHRSWARPVERDVLARIRRPLELVAERIHGTDRGLAPGHQLRTGPRLTAGRVHELRICPRQARRPRQRFRPGLHLSRDLRPPVGAVGRDLESNPGALHPANLPAFREQRSDLAREASGTAPDNQRKRLSLAVVGALVDEETGGPLD